MRKKIDIGPDGKILIAWKLNQADYSDEEERNIASLVAKKYDIPIKNVVIDRIYNRIGGGSDDIVSDKMAMNIHDPKFQHTLFKKYMEDYGIEGYDFDKLLAIDSQVNSLIDYNGYEKSRRYQIKWVKWNNFLSYGDDNYFDFTQLYGLVVLNGEPANESGKSTFAYDLLHFLLFGKVDANRARTNEQLFNNYRKDCNEVLVEGCINIEGIDYLIRRTLTRKGKNKISVSQKVEYYKILDDGKNVELSDFVNQNEENTAQTNKAIKEALGNEKDFDLMISANAKDLDDLISMGETDRGKLLSRWIGLSVLEDKEIKAKEIRKAALSKGRFSGVYNKITLLSDNESYEEEIKKNNELIEEERNRMNDANNEIIRLNNEKDALLSSKKMIDDSLLRIDAATLESKINNIIAEGNCIKNNIQSHQDELDGIPPFEFDKEYYDIIIKEKERLIGEIASIKHSIETLRSTNKMLQSQEYCPTCGKKLDNVDNSAIIKENNDKINSLINNGTELSEQKKYFEEDIKAMEKGLELSNKKAKLELKIMALDSDLKNKRIEYKENKDLLDKLNLNRQAIIDNNNIDTTINVLKASIRENETIYRNCSININTYTNINTNNVAKIKNNNGIIVKIDEEIEEEKNWGLYLRLIGKDGISKMVLRHSLPIINSEINSLLNDCADFNIEVSLNEDNVVEFWLIRDGIKTRLSAASGLERTQAALALRVVLGKMSRLSCPPFILLDEVLGTVAEVNYNKMKKLFDKIVNRYAFVLFITHVDASKEWADSIITIKKENNISKVKPLIINNMEKIR